MRVLFAKTILSFNCVVGYGGVVSVYGGNVAACRGNAAVYVGTAAVCGGNADMYGGAGAAELRGARSVSCTTKSNTSTHNLCVVCTRNLAACV